MKGNPMSTLESLSTGFQVGAVLPLLTAIVQRPAWSAQYKKIVAVITALVAGVVAVAVEGGWDQFQHGKLTMATLLGVLAASQTSYDLVWKPSKLAPMIESLTAKKTPQQA
jgi:peptidoglycan/LPS O-acetylase OafA/YrhL